MNILIDQKKALEVILIDRHADEKAAGKTDLEFIDWIRAKGIDLNVFNGKNIRQIVSDFVSEREVNQVCSYFYIKLFHHKTGQLRQKMTSAQVGDILGISRQGVEKNETTVKNYIDTEPDYRERINKIEQTIYSYFNNNTLNF